MKRSKYTVLAILLIAISITAAGCVTAQKQEPSAATSSETPVKKEEVKEEPKEPIKMNYWATRVDGVMQQYCLDLVERYEKATEGAVKIEYAEAPHGNEINTKLNAAFASGMGPDIIGEALSAIAPRTNVGQLLPLDEYIEKWKDKDDLSDYCYEVANYKGKIMGMAYAPQPYIFVYRKDYFEEAGLDPENPPKTWEELLEYAVKLTKTEGGVVTRAGFNLPIDDQRIIGAFARQNGATIVDDNDNPMLNTKEWIETLEFTTKLFNQSALPVTQKENDQFDLFAQGKAAMGALKPPSIAKMMQSDSSYKDKIGVFYPEEKSRGTFCGCSFLFMGSQTKYRDEAWKFIEFFMEKEEMLKRSEITQQPVVRKSIKDEFIAKDPFLNSAIYESFQMGVGSPKVPWSAYYFSTYLPTMQQEAYYNKKTPEQSIKDNYEKLLKYIDDTK